MLQCVALFCWHVWFWCFESIARSLTGVAVCCNVLQIRLILTLRIRREKPLPCCSVLQCSAVRCSSLQCVAVCCSVLQCVADRSDSNASYQSLEASPVLQCAAVCCSVLRVRLILTLRINREKLLWCCIVLQCVAVCCSVLPCFAGTSDSDASYQSSEASPVWHDSFICVPCPNYMCDMTKSFVWHVRSICITWHPYRSDMSHKWFMYDMTSCMTDVSHDMWMWMCMWHTWCHVTYMSHTYTSFWCIYHDVWHMGWLRIVGSIKS